MDIQAPAKTVAIRTLNDLFRKTFVGGVVVLTNSVNSLEPQTKDQLLRAVQSFRDFSEDNDPHGEHDFGSVKIRGSTYFFKIDAYDRSMEMGSPDPSDPNVTKRVLTLMEASEY